MSQHFLAVDWGTTNRRVFSIENGLVVATHRDARGAVAVQDFPAEVADLRARFGNLPMLLAGMVGSNIGWRAVPYVHAPAGLAELAEALDHVEPGVAIVPGIAYHEGSRGDVMRGEEVQLLGAAAAATVPTNALLCQPGTHCKWATVEDGKIVRFTTAMTGELFALLRTNSLLAPQLSGQPSDSATFREGVLEGARRDLAASLFGIRASGVLGLRDDAQAAAFASGLLIGADVAARLAESAAAAVHILSDPALGGLYVAAVETLGGAATLADSHAAFIAGITRLWDLAS